MITASSRTTATDQDRAGRLAIVLFFAGVLLSTTVVLNLGDLTISADRVVLLVFFLPTLVALGRSNSIRMQAFDYCIFATIAWIILALMVNNGFERGLKYGGSLTLEAVGAWRASS
jgi:hypothetical protein